MKIFYDVDTQNDFMNKSGALYVPDAESIKPNLLLLTAIAQERKIPIFGSVDKHFGTELYKVREGELNRWGGPFPDHCMTGTFGQLKIDETTLSGKYPEKGGKWPASLFIHHDKEDKVSDWIIKETLKEVGEASKHQAQDGIYFEKQSYDVFTNPATERILKITQVTDALIYGVATDYCVKAAVLGMQKLGIQTYVVDDAIKGVSPDSTKSALEEMLAVGARFVKTKDVLEGKNMVVTPKEAIKLNAEKDKRAVALLERMIDDRLREDFNGTSVYFDLEDRYPGEKVIREIKERYQTSGWNVRYESDQREGAYLIFSEARR